MQVDPEDELLLPAFLNLRSRSPRAARGGASHGAVAFGIFATPSRGLSKRASSSAKRKDATGVDACRRPHRLVLGFIARGSPGKIGTGKIITKS